MPSPQPITDLARILPPRIRIQNGYRVATVRGRSIPEHRLVWEFAFGPLAKGQVVHHLNERKDDNRLENLREMSNGDHTSLHHRRFTPDEFRARDWRFDACLRRLGVCTGCKTREARFGEPSCLICYENYRARHTKKTVPYNRDCPTCGTKKFEASLRWCPCGYCEHLVTETPENRGKKEHCRLCALAANRKST